MTLIPYMIAAIAGIVAWNLAKRFGGLTAAIPASLIVSTLAFYYARRYMKGLKDSIGM